MSVEGGRLLPDGKHMFGVRLRVSEYLFYVPPPLKQFRQHVPALSQLLRKVAIDDRLIGRAAG